MQRRQFPRSSSRPTAFASLIGGGQAKRVAPCLYCNQHFTGNLDNWDPAVLDGLAKERGVIIFNNAGVASSTGEVPTTFVGMSKNAEAFINGLGLTKVDLLGFCSASRCSRYSSWISPPCGPPTA